MYASLVRAHLEKEIPGILRVRVVLSTGVYSIHARACLGRIAAQLVCLFQQCNMCTCFQRLCYTNNQKKKKKKGEMEMSGQCYLLPSP